MKKITFITIGLICFFRLSSEAQQNCYNNPSIEGPSQSGVVPSPWNACWGSPDTFPGPWGITLPASNGSTYVGFLASNNYSYLEGMTQPLTTCMVAGQEYTFTVDLAHSNTYDGAGPGNCYSAFAVWGGNSACSRTEQLYCSGEIWNTTWQSYTITFTPTGNWCYIGFSPCYLTACSGYINLLMDNISCIDTVSGVVATTDVTCFGACDGTASANPIGGTPPYAYSWSPGGQTTSSISGLCPGTYTVTITDAGNQVTTADGIVVQPPALVLNTSKTDVSCLGGSDGSATVNASGGTGAYTYLWSPGGGTTQTVAGLTAGSYCVTVTDSNGCQEPAECVTIIDGGTVTANISASTNVSCTGGNDGSATVTVTDGIPPYIFLWGNGQTTPTVTLLTMGTHCVTVTDSKGCNTNVCVVITEPTPLVAVINLTVDLNCNSICDGQATVAPSGGTSPYTYLWDNGQTLPIATGLCAGTFGVTVIDANGCTTTASATINQPAPLALTTTKIDPGCMDSCDGSATVTVAGGTIPYTYLWNDPNAQITPTANNLCDGAYIIQVTDNNGCIVSTTVVLNDPPPFIAFIDTSINIDCNGACNGYAQVSTSGGGAPYTYLWNTVPPQTTDQATNVCPGTLAVMVINANGCRSLALTVITEPPLLTDTISSINVTCFGACNGVATVTVLGGVMPYTYQWDAGTGFQTTPIAINLCSDPAGITYTVVVTDVNGCTLTDNVIITQPLELGLIQSVVSPTTCSSNNGSACVVASGGVSPYTYLWNDSNATDSTCITNVFAGLYNPTVTDAMGCQFTMPVLINDIAGPTIDSISTNSLSCYGDVTGIATVFISGGTPNFSYIWNTDVGDTISLGPSDFIFGLPGGNYSVTIVDNNMCVESDTFSIYEPSQLASGILSYTNLSCKNSCDGDVTVGVAGGTTPYTYLWTPSGQTIAFATGLCAGLHNVLITDANGCTTTSSESIIEPDLLVVTPAVTHVSCKDVCDGTATVTPGGGTPPYNYLWTPGGQTINNIDSLCDGTYDVEVTDANGCLALESIIVSEPQQLIASGSSFPSTCGNANGTATVSPMGGTQPYYFLWDDPNFQTNDTATGLLADTFTVVVTDANNCTLTFPVTVIDVAGPVIDSITVTGVNCNGGANGSATVWISGGSIPYTYLWDDGQTATIVNTTHTAIGLPAGNISVTITDLNGCAVTGNDTVAEPNALMVNIAGGGTICYGQSATISANVTGGTLPYAYTWDNGLPDSVSHIVLPVVTTTYTVTVTDANGCSLSQTVTVIVNPPLTVSAADVTICEGDDAIFGAGVTSPGNGGPYMFTWDNSFVGDTQTVSGLTTDSTIFRVILSDGCSDNDTAYVTVFIDEVPNFYFSTICVDPPIPSLIQFNSSVVSGGVPPYTYDWDYGDGNIGTGDTVTHLYAGGSGLYNVSLTVTTVQGCSGNYSLIIQGPPDAVFIATPPEEATILNPVFAFNDTTFNALTNVVVWEWDFGDGGTLVGFDSAGANPTHTYSDTGTYDVLLTVYNSDGCKDTAWRTVKVISEYILFAPSAFFPESYIGKNRYFRPVGIGIDNEEFEIFIYDRWGNNIYEYDGRYDTWLGWDGRANGGKKMAQIDVYIWLIILEDLNGEPHQYVGHVTLMK